MLVKEIRSYLNSLSSSGRIYFFPSYKIPHFLVGAIHGQLMGVLVLEGRKINREELIFSQKLKNAHGLVYTMSSMDDCCFTAKTEGWHD